MLNIIKCCHCNKEFETEIQQYQSQRSGSIATATATIQCPNCQEYIGYDLYDNEIRVVASSDGSGIYYIVALMIAIPIIVYLLYLYLSLSLH